MNRASAPFPPPQKKTPQPQGTAERQRCFQSELRTRGASLTFPSTDSLNAKLLTWANGNTAVRRGFIFPPPPPTPQPTPPLCFPPFSASLNQRFLTRTPRQIEHSTFPGSRVVYRAREPSSVSITDQLIQLQESQPRAESGAYPPPSPQIPPQNMYTISVRVHTSREGWELQAATAEVGEREEGWWSPVATRKS